jgi:DNA-binding transcriptional LysR family regulator
MHERNYLMRRPLPPLNALRAFDAAARHLSFTRAAEELAVTQAAISHQVKALEARLGVKLFRRLTRALRLTDEGTALAPGLRDAFERLEQAVERVRAPGRAVLTLSTLTTFAATWLTPRLPRFQAAHPDIEVRISVNSRLVDFAREDVDAAIRFGDGAWPGLATHRLFSLRLAPLAPPALAQRLKSPADLARVPLIDTLPSPGEWVLWLDRAGLRHLAPRGGGVVFDSTLLALGAAARGMGVAVGDPLLAADELEAGRLVQPFELVVTVDSKAFWLVHPEGFAERPKIRAFREWILGEAEAFRREEPSPGTRAAGRAAAARPRSATAARAPGRGGGSRG